MPASLIAAFTAAATFSTIAGRPISSGRSSALMAVPMARRDFAPRARGRGAGEDRGVRGDDTVAAARPDHGDLRDLLFRPPPMLRQHTAERLVGEDAREVVHAAIALGLADHGNDLVGG